MFKIDSKVDKPDIKYMQERSAELMKRGIKIGDAERIYSEYKSIQTELAQELYDEYGISNPNSTKQITWYMKNLESAEVYNVCFIDGKWSTKKELLQILSELGYEFADKLLKYRKAKKFAESCASLIDAMDADRLIHPTVSFSKTNRVNYSGPALMNIPKELLWALIVPSKAGNKLIAADIKNQEPSIMINMLNVDELKSSLTDPIGLYESLFNKAFQLDVKLNVWVIPENTDETGVWGVEKMAKKSGIPPIYYSAYKPLSEAYYIDGDKVVGIGPLNTVTNPGKEPDYPKTVELYMESGETLIKEVCFGSLSQKKLGTTGVHELNGSLSGVSVECAGVVRSEFKVAWNAMTYGASEFGIRQMCKHIDSKTVYKFFSRVKEFKEYRTKCTKLADDGIQNIRTYFGTLLYAEEYNKSILKRVLMDLPIQGTGADILSLLIKHFDNETEKLGLKDKIWIYYSRHDELIIEASDDYITEVGITRIKETVKDLLEHQVDDWVPFKLEIKAIEEEEINTLATLGLED